MERVLLHADRAPQSAVMEHHNKQEEGTERLFRFQAAHYRVGDTFEDFVYKGQLVQAEALKCAVEHWRRRKFDTAGSLFWQLNDCWPVSSWSVIDSDLRPKAGYFYAKRFYAPVLVSFKRAGHGVQVWLTSDLLQPVRGELTVELLSFAGNVEWTKRAKINMAANASRRILDLPEREYLTFAEDRHYLLAKFESGGITLSENRFFFVEPKHFRLPAGRPHASVRWAADGEGVLVVRAAGFVKNLFVDLPGAMLEDNFVDLDGGGTREIRFRSSAPNKLLVPLLHWLH
jgi:beta-mannosidase